MIQDPITGVPLALSSGATNCPAFNTSDGVLFKGGNDCFTLIQLMEQKRETGRETERETERERNMEEGERAETVNIVRGAPN